MVISHIPFTFKKKAPVFDIERELYSKWGKLIKENIKPSLMLCGHTHNATISEPGSEMDELGNPCPVVIGSDFKRNEDGTAIFAGSLIKLKNNQADIIFNTENNIVAEYTIAI